MAENKSENEGLDPSLTETASAFELIQSILEEEEAEERKPQPDQGFELPIERVIGLLPREYVLAPRGVTHRQRRVSIAVPDLFVQLARGKVEVTVAQLSFNMPADLVTPEAHNADDVLVPLPLPEVVAAMQPQSLTQRIPGAYRHYNLTAVNDPFAETPAAVSPPAPAAPAEAARPAPPIAEAAAIPKSVPETAPAAVATAAPTGSPPATAAPPAPAPAVTAAEGEPDEIDRLGGVNANTATFEQLMTLDGMTPAIAEAILRTRADRKGFASIFELYDVPGVGRKRFRLFTGMPYNDKRISRRRRLASLLRMPVTQVGSLPAVAASLARRLNFAGCVISDTDGMVLAQSLAGQEAEPIVAVMPRIHRFIRDQSSPLALGELHSVAICLGDRMFSVAVSGQVYLTCIHESRRLTKSQMDLFNRVAAEVAWLLSLRAYIGPPA